jgi:hypothetical protein
MRAWKTGPLLLKPPFQLQPAPIEWLDLALEDQIRTVAIDVSDLIPFTAAGGGKWI